MSYKGNNCDKCTEDKMCDECQLDMEESCLAISLYGCKSKKIHFWDGIVTIAMNRIEQIKKEKENANSR